MNLIFFILGVIGILYSSIVILTLPKEDLQDDNSTGLKLMLIFICSMLLIGLNANHLFENQLVIDILTP